MAELLPSDELVEEPSDYGSLAPGARLGRYELLVPVARGGMARVWAARLHAQRGFQKLVALKTILPHLAREKQFERMFLDEARIASGVHHPNVCEIYELGEEQSTLYLAMEWVSGDSLARLVRGSAAPEALDARVAARLIADACAGVHAAHELTDEDGRELGVVHRDLSPHNILLTLDGHAKVADFGVAKALGQLHEATSAGQLKGKLAYMAPEQITGAPVDRRSDVFSLGCVLYEATTGQRPFRGEGDHQVMHAVLKGEFQAPSALVRGYPVELERIVQRALAAQAILRYPTAERMRFALEEFLARGSLVTTTNVAQVLKARLGAVLDKRKERIRQASSVEDRERVARWSEPPTGGQTPADGGHRSGVKQATPKAFPAQALEPGGSPGHLDAPTVRENARAHGVVRPDADPQAVPASGVAPVPHGYAMYPANHGWSPTWGGIGHPQDGGPSADGMGGMGGMPPQGFSGVPHAPPTGGHGAAFAQTVGVPPTVPQGPASQGHAPGSGAFGGPPYGMTPPHGATPFGVPATFAGAGPSSSAVPIVGPPSGRGPVGEGRPAPASTGQYALAIGIGVLVAGVIAGAGLYAWKRQHAGATVASPTAAPAPASASAAPASASAAHGELVFETTPTDATLFLDGRALGSGVRRTPRPPAGTTATLVVRAPGKRDATRLVDYFTNSPMRITLEDAPALADAPEPSAASAKPPEPKPEPVKPATAAPPGIPAGAKPDPRPKAPKPDPALPANPY